MALDKQKKKQIIDESSEVLEKSQLIVLARYSGTSVKSLQQLRRKAKDSDTTVKVIKNRLFKKALSASPKYKDLDSSIIDGQLIYAYSSSDEIAPAQSLAEFAKDEPQIVFVAALTADGQLLNADDVQKLASLSSKQELLSRLVAVTAAPLVNFLSVLGGSKRGLLNVLNAKAEQS